MREKLIELLNEEHSKSTDEVVFNCATYAQQLEMESDHLIANGVTIQKWIPVSERLPEMYKNVLVIRTDGKVRFDAIGSLGVWYEEVWHAGNPVTHHYSCDKVTHWMPIPEPQKDASE